MHLVHGVGVDPAGVLAVSFTKKAAEEVVLRLAAAGIPRNLVTCVTFHSFCMRIIFRWYKVRPPGGGSKTTYC
jgi:superfamily I DNA/RNA helicase